MAVTVVVLPCAAELFQFLQVQDPPSMLTICWPLTLTIAAVSFGEPALVFVQRRPGPGRSEGSAVMEPSNTSRVSAWSGAQQRLSRGKGGGSAQEGMIRGTSLW